MSGLENLLVVSFRELPFFALALIISFTVHEFAHAYVAYKFGDDTPYKDGRVTLNPAVHLDLFGAILILIAGFGWAKPVMVRASNFKNPRMMSVIVSAAGPLSNLLMGIISVFAINILNETGWLYAVSPQVTDAITMFFQFLVQYSFLLFVFNLIPLPPLDGYRIVVEFLPLRQRIQIEQNAHWGSIIFLLMVFIPPLREVTLDPILGLGNKIAIAVINMVHLIV
ncbi:site-2 protease family protein [Paenibacillus yanchengensis]|uniref:Site-2 protease family protein n=1 Tax=Paenibacillus yanchengensis TaxID=2035833 RepID=A0ABW4YKC7_9BACL